MLALPLRGPEWQHIQTVLLDLDGTLLDLHYDTHFWHEVVPAAWGAPRGLSVSQAAGELRPRFKAVEGTLNWYCTDFWTRELGLDVIALKRRDTTRIGWLPGAREFVRAARAAGKRLVLATNSHPDVLAIKNEQASVFPEFDACISSHAFGVPKESPQFWEQLQRTQSIDLGRTLFADDSLPVLRAAKRAGVAHLIVVRKPNSMRDANQHTEFQAVDGIAELL